MLDLPAGALAGVRALDLIDGLGAYGPKLIAGLGADVIRVEPPGGARDRRTQPPYGAFEGGGDRPSLYFMHYNAGKQGVTLDTSSARGRDILARLLDSVDVVFDNGHLQRLGFDLDSLVRKARPLTIVSVTPFGLTGERAGWLGSDLVCQAMSGMIHYYGYRDERPARYGARQASEIAGLAAALGALIALFDARRTGRGEVVDIAAERVGALVSFQMSNASLYHQFGFVRQRHQRGAEVPNLYQASDGYVQLAAFRSLAPLVGVFEKAGVGAPIRELAASLKGEDFARNPKVQEVVRAFVSSRTRMEVSYAAQAEDVMCVPIHDVADLIADPFLQGRAYFVEVEPPGGGQPFRDVGVPIRFQKTLFRAGRRPPLSGEHNAEVYGGIGLTDGDLKALSAEGVI